MRGLKCKINILHFWIKMDFLHIHIFHLTNTSKTHFSLSKSGTCELFSDPLNPYTIHKRRKKKFQNFRKGFQKRFLKNFPCSFCRILLYPCALLWSIILQVCYIISSTVCRIRRSNMDMDSTVCSLA